MSTLGRGAHLVFAVVTSLLLQGSTIARAQEAAPKEDDDKKEQESPMVRPAPDMRPPRDRRERPDSRQMPRRRSPRRGLAFAYVPNMYGDLFFGGGFFSGGFSTIPIAGGDRLVKIAENNRPEPTDRVFYNMHHFHNALLLDGAVATPTHLDRYTFGIERTFGSCREWSAEVRIPFADGVNSVQDPITGGREAVEFGNISFAFKRLLWKDGCNTVSTGLGVTLPTAQDAALTNLALTLFIIESDSVHLQPFIGWSRTPNDRVFMHAFAQMDFDTNGNAVSSPVGIVLGGRRLHDQSLLMLDASLGYWAYKDPCAKYLRGIAPFIEMHYTTTMQNADTFNGLGNPFNRMDILNLSSGMHFKIGSSSWLSIAAVVPLRDREEKLFDTEVGLQYNRRF